MMKTTNAEFQKIKAELEAIQDRIGALVEAEEERYSSRSETWQESARGEEVQEEIDSMECIGLSDAIEAIENLLGE